MVEREVVEEDASDSNAAAVSSDTSAETALAPSGREVLIPNPSRDLVWMTGKEA